LKLYFDGKIRQWYSRGDGKGVVFLDAKTEDEARAVMETLPLAKEQLIRNPAVPPSPTAVRGLFAMASNCCADHHLGDKCLLSKLLQPQGERIFTRG
jgi:hypothetical protein